MWRLEGLDGLTGGVGGIYSLQPLPSRWLALLSMGTLDSPVVHQIYHCSLSGECHVSRPLGFGVVDSWGLLSSCGTGQSGGTPDSPVCFDVAVLTSALFIVPSSAQSTVGRSWPLLHWLTGQSGGTPDSLVNFSEVALRKLESGQFARAAAWDTEQCPMRHRPRQVLYAPNFVELSKSIFCLSIVNFMHLIKTFTRQTS
jgi:hypothetical protein